MMCGTSSSQTERETKMAITPADIEQQTFSPAETGYNPEEVDAFLDAALF